MQAALSSGRDEAGAAGAEIADEFEDDELDDDDEQAERTVDEALARKAVVAPAVFLEAKPDAKAAEDPEADEQ
jgi:hypothetical protein